jgi:hypothetical protein
LGRSGADQNETIYDDKPMMQNMGGMGWMMGGMGLLWLLVLVLLVLGVAALIKYLGSGG